MSLCVKSLLALQAGVSVYVRMFIEVALLRIYRSAVERLRYKKQVE